MDPKCALETFFELVVMQINSTMIDWPTQLRTLGDFLATNQAFV